ncbi:hypothetical protein GWK47_047097 [Chionoecetes opilio]|uniref:Uncharacterized protein n=1 Tax=Chionoecetes opilio TaxID=41210 RepID=A0A8J5CWV2_CHIOP|nr:hypothetical protein GWK47_047097 [Chionoecetes opilio]
MDLTTKEHVDRLPIIISGIGGAQLLAVANLGQWHGREHGGSGGLGPGDMGVADQVVGMSFDTTASTPAAETGACFLIEQKMGKDLLHFRLSSPYPGAGGTCGVLSVFLGVPHRPSICSSNAFPKPHGGASTERTSAKGIMVEEVATVLEDVKDEALRWTLQVPLRA